jgi:hypothetical protein
MSLTISPVLTALIIGFVVLVFLAGFVRQRSRPAAKPRADATTWWTSSDAGRRDPADRSNDRSDAARDDPSSTADSGGGSGDDGGGGGDGD